MDEGELAYYMPPEEFRFILAAIDFVAAHGHRFRRSTISTGPRATGPSGAARSSTTMMDELLHDLGSSNTKTKGNKRAVDDNDKFESYLQFATKLALSLPETCDDYEQQLPEGIDPDIILFRA
ncbi:hypothetical protein ZWY2020_006724 [Hordeum vulgare]|nr:hypothetical protein ZWY2020_006724 [Hordeum vulgare]